MKRNSILVVLLSTLLLSFSSATMAVDEKSSDELKTKASETWDAFKRYLHDQKHKAIEHGKELLDEVDVEIDVLQKKAAEASGELKLEYQETIENLKTLKADAALKLDALEDSTAEAWSVSKEGFADAYKRLYKAYKDALTKFK